MRKDDEKTRLGARQAWALIAAVAALTVLCTVTGGSGRELETYAIAAGAALDRGEGGRVRLTLEVADVSGGEAEGPTGSLCFSAEGETMSDATLALERQMGKPIYWSHASILLLSQELCRDGIETIAEWVLRAYTLRIAVPLAVTEGESGALLRRKIEFFSVCSYGLRSLLDNARENGTGVEMPVYSVYGAMKSASKTAVLPLLSTRGESPVLSGAAVVREGKLCGSLSEEETVVFRLMTDGIPQGVLTAQGRSFRTDQTQVSLSAAPSGESLSFFVRAELDQGDPGGNPGEILQEALTRRAEALWEKAQRLDADLFGLKNARLRARLPERELAELSPAIFCEVYLVDYGQSE